MDYYTIVSRDNNVLVNLLLSEVVENNIKSLNDWRTCYYYGIDGILVNLVYNLIQDNKMYNKERIDTEFDILLKPIYNKTSQLSDNQFYDIFNNIWNSIFSIKGKKYFIKTLARENQPLWKKLMNNNTFLIFFGVLMTLIGYGISEMIHMPELVRYDEYDNYVRNIGGSWIVSIFLVFLSVIGVSLPNKKESFMNALYFPLIVAFGVIGYHVLILGCNNEIEALEAVQISKRWFWVSVVQCLWIPVWKINKERITEEKPLYEDLYRKEYKIR